MLWNFVRITERLHYAGIYAHVSSNSQRFTTSFTADRGGASEDCQTDWVNSTLTHRDLWRLQEKQRVGWAFIFFLAHNGILALFIYYFLTFRCVICMVEFMVGDSVRYLPCMHTYHVECIDDWLMRSFTCPSCMEPVESALLSTYEAN